ncbi:NO-inducible flavohemoprotein [Niallia sp. FSL W8-0177]|uniref:NO-inducible flavohemoprotein n=1 Tax=Niallia TaxID=2837506 RepID=UPI0030F51074
MLSQKTIDIIKSTVPVLQVHGTQITTVFYKNMFAAHPELLNIFNHANQARGRQQTALANTVLAAAQNIDQLETIIPVVKQIAHKHRSLMVKAEHYPIVGEFLLKAIKEVLGDAATDEIIQAWADAYGVIAQVFIDIEKEMYEESASKNGGWADYKEFKVMKKIKESDVITSFYLAPADGSSLPAYEAGQYITIRLSIPGEKFLFNRQYSLSCASNKEYFRISVKKEASVENPDGKVSNYLHSDIDVDDLIEVTVPAGDFTLLKEESQIVFISGGVGITPFMSMVGTIAKEQPDREVQFIHSARSGSVQAFKEELIQLKEKIANFNLSYIYENPSEEDKLNPFFQKAGYIDADWLKENAITADGHYYVCGPVPFLQAVITGLKANGVDDSQIHYEFFGPSMKL